MQGVEHGHHTGARPHRRKLVESREP